MNDFVRSCNAAARYPKNLIFPGEYQHSLQTYIDQLDERDTHLFDVENKAALDFWELDNGLASTMLNSNMKQPHPLTISADFQLTTTKSHELEKHMHFPPLAPRIDPVCRYVWVFNISLGMAIMLKQLQLCPRAKLSGQAASNTKDVLDIG